MRSGGEHCHPELAVEVRWGTLLPSAVEVPRRWQRRRRRTRTAADIETKDPHLTVGESDSFQPVCATDVRYRAVHVLVVLGGRPKIRR